MVYVDGEKNPTFKHDSQEQAEKEAERLSKKLGKRAYILEAVGVTLPKEINVEVDSFEKACGYLGGENHGSCDCHNKHHKAMLSLFKLVTIAEAWNKADDFVPDFSDRNQYKYYPWFTYSGASAGFAYAHTSYAASYTATNVGSRLCFKTRELAMYAGTQFRDLYFEYLFVDMPKNYGK
jgi:hypothetical protein